MKIRSDADQNWYDSQNIISPFMLELGWYRIQKIDSTAKSDVGKTGGKKSSARKLKTHFLTNYLTLLPLAKLQTRDANQLKIKTKFHQKNFSPPTFYFVIFNYLVTREKKGPKNNFFALDPPTRFLMFFCFCRKLLFFPIWLFSFL